ncbi:MAG: tetratricopeptide repeat protein [Bacteroidales bacterium]|nr:tetratricopeptide repeat protein [Bacteroidales bacterium]MDD6723094.1 tetratricopeptide repeat protein [Bacteroidales bacterium]
MKTPFKTIIATLALLILTLPASFAATAVQQADSAYNKKNFQDALYYYQAAAEKDGVSSDLYYNMGNTYYRLGDLGHAVLNYRRALALDPSNEEARLNLEFVRTKITDKPEDDSTFLRNVHLKIVSWMSPDAWAWTSMGVFALMIGLIAIYLFAPSVNARKVGFFGAFVILFIFIYTLYVAWSSANAYNGNGRAVVTAPVTNLRSTPASSNSSADKVVPIHEGTELIILDSLATPDDPKVPLWYDVKINNTSRAWLPAADVEKV